MASSQAWLTMGVSAGGSLSPLHPTAQRQHLQRLRRTRTCHVGGGVGYTLGSSGGSFSRRRSSEPVPSPSAGPQTWGSVSLAGFTSFDLWVLGGNARKPAPLSTPGLAPEKHAGTVGPDPSPRTRATCPLTQQLQPEGWPTSHLGKVPSMLGHSRGWGRGRERQMGDGRVWAGVLLPALGSAGKSRARRAQEEDWGI